MIHIATIKVFSPCGKKLESRHGYYVDDKGDRLFGKIEDVDVTRRINAAAQGSTLYEMIEKYQKTGDDSFLFKKAKSFNADLTVMPKNLIELYNMKNTCAEDFKKFPVDYRALFNHNVDEYFKAIQDNTIEEKTKSYFESKGKEIKKDEQASE